MNWNINKYEAKVILGIAQRAHAMDSNYKLMDIEMDLTAVHLNDCRLKLQELAQASEFDFAHDVFGIAQHLDRETGKLQDCFLPRYAA